MSSFEVIIPEELEAAVIAGPDRTDGFGPWPITGVGEHLTTASGLTNARFVAERLHDLHGSPRRSRPELVDEAWNEQPHLHPS